jgi:hypothetical protein
MEDTTCQHCENGCEACDARFTPETPYAWFHYKDFTLIYHDVWEELIEGHNDWVPLYLEQQRTWVGLTENEKADVLIGSDGRIMDYDDVVDAVEAKLKEKNT